jgi:voltage-gated potassium channel
MKEETKKNIRELKVTLVIIVVFIAIATLIISFYSRMNIENAFETTFIELMNAGTAGTSSALGNIFYVVIIFFTLGVTFYMFEKVIILLSQFGLGGILMKANLSSIKDHYIVCGAGRVGTHAAEKLKEAGKKVVIVENDCPTSEFLKKRGFMIIDGDCMSEDTLEKAQIRKAKGILACTGEDNKNVFVVLTAKDLNSSIKIATRVNDQKSRGEFERAGASIIVTPEVTGGYELADKMIGVK